MTESIRVLIVDDDPKLLAVWQRFLSKKPGLECVGALHTSEGLGEKALETGAHVILMDLSMEGRDPLEIIKDMRAAHIPARVLVYTGRSDRSLGDKVALAGAWGLADKLEDPNAIIEHIRRIAAADPQ